MYHCYSAVWLTLIVFLQLFIECRSRCYDQCDKYRPQGTTDAYVLNCSDAAKTKMELHHCANCVRCPQEICRKTDPEKQLLYCPEDSEGLSIAAIIGIAIAVVVAIAILYYCLTKTKIDFCRICKRKRRVAPARGQQPLVAAGRPTRVATATPASSASSAASKTTQRGGKGMGAPVVRGGIQGRGGKAHVMSMPKKSYRPDGL